MTPQAPHVRTWRQPDGLWRWDYVEPERDGQARLTLTGHRAYETLDEARDSALAAYPGVDLQEPRQPEADDRQPEPVPLWLVVAVLVVIFLVRRRARRAE